MTEDPLRPDNVASLLAKAKAAAPTAGISRLADVTRLDCIGMPVWQAIRPMGRALSVHQGRGRTPSEAMLGALMEAMESHSAENFAQIDRTTSWDMLDPELRYGEWSDFARDRDAVPDPRAIFDWTFAYGLDGRRFLVPFANVSMDLTTLLGTGLDRSTNGLAAGFTRNAARTAAVLELIERDAVTSWRKCGLVERMKCSINLADLAFEWLDEWQAKLKTAGARLQCFRVPSIINMPVIAAELSDLGKGTKAYRAIEGSAAHPLPELALLRAVSEVIQGRCAYIAGSRDDILPKDYEAVVGAVQMVFGLPLPPNMDAVELASIPSSDATLDDICRAVESAGYGPVVFVDVGDVGDVKIVKAFAAGLGSRRRGRRGSR